MPGSDAGLCGDDGYTPVVRVRKIPEATRSSDNALTLFDVPLEVRAERMILRNGRLVTAPDATPSASARTFASWFTEAYQDIATEAYSIPPAEMGMDSVAVFNDLRRVALISAIAESLRDQGIVMPFWMIDYPVPSLSVEPTTPSITVDNSTYSIFGGGLVARRRECRDFCRRTSR